MNKMKLVVTMVATVMVTGCGPDIEVVKVYKGDPGTSCSVSSELDSETFAVLGARVSCTDGTFAVVLNGQQGPQGLQGVQGVQGIQGPVGQTGTTGASCQAYRVNILQGVLLACPNQLPTLISDGRDGQDGQSCSSTRQNSQSRVKITCGSQVTYVYDGQNGNNGTNGTNGTSCTVVQASGGANVKCGNSTVFLANGSSGPQGSIGPQGQPGRDGLNGLDGEDAVNPGLSCNVHNLSNWDGVTNILTVLANNPPVGNFVLPALNIGDSPSVNGFPGMPTNLQNLVGLEGYALDCNGYLNIATSGMHTLKTLSDDGIRVVIQDQVVINNPGLHAPTTDASTSRELQRGPNKLNVIYYQGPHSQIALQLKMSGPNTAEAVVPASFLTH